MKTIPALLQADYDSGVTTLATIWRVERADDQVFGFTSHDAPIIVDGLRYEPRSAFDPSSIALRAEMNVDGGNVVGVLDGQGIDSADIEAGIWDGADVLLMRVNWAAPDHGAEEILSGQTGVAQRQRGRYEIELRGLMLYLQNNLGRPVTPLCDAELGDARCGIDLEALRVAGTVSEVDDSRSFVASDLPGADDYYSFGEVTWTSGENSGRRMEIKSSANAGSDSDGGAAIVLQLQMPDPIEIGDAFTIVPGCDKTKPTCKGVFDNVVNFRGFSFVPGQNRAITPGGQ